MSTKRFNTRLFALHSLGFYRQLRSEYLSMESTIRFFDTTEQDYYMECDYDFVNDGQQSVLHIGNDVTVSVSYKTRSVTLRPAFHPKYAKLYTDIYYAFLSRGYFPIDDQIHLGLAIVVAVGTNKDLLAFFYPKEAYKLAKYFRKASQIVLCFDGSIKLPLDYNCESEFEDFFMSVWENRISFVSRELFEQKLFSLVRDSKNVACYFDMLPILFSFSDHSIFRLNNSSNFKKLARIEKQQLLSALDLFLASTTMEKLYQQVVPLSSKLKPIRAESQFIKVFVAESGNEDGFLPVAVVAQFYDWNETEPLPFGRLSGISYLVLLRSMQRWVYTLNLADFWVSRLSNKKQFHFNHLLLSSFAMSQIHPSISYKTWLADLDATKDHPSPVLPHAELFRALVVPITNMRPSLSVEINADKAILFSEKVFNDENFASFVTNKNRKMLRSLLLALLAENSELRANNFINTMSKIVQLGETSCRVARKIIEIVSDYPLVLKRVSNPEFGRLLQEV